MSYKEFTDGNYEKRSNDLLGTNDTAETIFLVTPVAPRVVSQNNDKQQNENKTSTKKK